MTLGDIINDANALGATEESEVLINIFEKGVTETLKVTVDPATLDVILTVLE